METRDEQLFSKEVPLLTAASELCYHTVHCSALNAEELRRENGIEVSASELQKFTGNLLDATFFYFRFYWKRTVDACRS